MKKIIWQSLLLAQILYCTENIFTEAPIKEVTVFPDRAMVKRFFSIPAQEGKHSFIITNLPFSALSDSACIILAGAELLAVTVREEMSEAARSSGLAALKEELKILKGKKNSLQMRMQEAKHLENFLNSLRSAAGEKISHELLISEQSVKAAEYLIKLLKTEYRGTYDALLTAQNESDLLQVRIAGLEQKIKNLEFEKPLMHKDIRVEARFNGACTGILSYLIKGVSWEPVYDVKIYNSGLMETTMHASIIQSSGEDWKNVLINVSTAKPAVAGYIDNLEPWYVDFYRPRLGGRYSLNDNNSEIMSARSVKQEPALVLEECKAEDESARFVSTGGVTAVFSAADTETVLSENSPRKISVVKQQFKCTLTRLAIPKKSGYAYVQAFFTNTADFPLLSGKTEIMRENMYIGSSLIPMTAPGQSTAIMAGIDEDIAIERLDPGPVQGESGLFGNMNRKSFQVIIRAKNFKKTAQTLIITDQIPFPKNTDIRVKLVSAAPKPQEKEFGILEWSLEIPAQGNCEIFFKFHIEYPKDMQIDI
ncbi:MAG TPA: hypothetical protein DC049_12030 [Spirochaetia bacterium]|nr:hypothetical protein [Spirochaetia bacterium]